MLQEFPFRNQVAVTKIESCDPGGFCLSLNQKSRNSSVLPSSKPRRTYMRTSTYLLKFRNLKKIFVNTLKDFIEFADGKKLHFPRSLLVLLFVAFTLVLLPGKYLITIGILGIFLGNPDFKKVFRHTLFQLKLWLKRWLQKLFHLQKYWLAPKSTAGTNSTKSNLNEEDTTGRAHEDQWYDAETVSESEVEDDIVEVDDIEDDEYEDVPSVERQKKVVCGLTKVSHFNNSRKKKKQINRGNCAACDVSFSSVLKKRQYCRHCGVSFCSRCCCKRVKRAVFGATAPAAYEETVLVCKSCYGYLMNKVDDMKTDIW
ncbi:PREDICTED: protrudin-like isoform X2 [Acropora digitifera]|uniref:protrudin-like isoform X2 n=1 Tax=Acropora digitifera TaxID=70779 RepID=UPI00077A29DC|nr:PREDICTED: protrudin-like isoform X2 [Acropora digitifera]